jgi:hypothetical protein
MTSSSPVPAQSPTRVHPIVGFTRALAGALDRVLVHEPAFLTPDDKKQVLVELAHAPGSKPWS